jgi:hypothetical protein
MVAGCAENWARRLAQCHTRCLTRSHWPVGSSVDRHLVGHRSPPLRPLGQVGTRRKIGQPRVAKGQQGAAISIPTQKGLLFTPDHPRLSCCSDFKDAK